MNPLLKFIVKRLEGKINDLAAYQDEVENYDAYMKVMNDVEDYFAELRTIIEDVIT